MHIQLHFKVKGSMRNLHPTTMPLWALIKGIQENEKLHELTADGRNLDPDEFKKWKPRNLMAIYLGAKYRDKKGRPDLENVSGYTGLAGYDFDDVTPDEVLPLLKSIPQVVCAGVSASGSGVWCAAKVNAATDTEYRACFADGLKAFLDAGLPGIDRGCHDPTRARFVAGDPDCWWRYDAMDDIPAFEPVGDLNLLGNPNKKKKKQVKLPSNYKLSPELAHDQMLMKLQEVDDVEDGDRNNAKARMCGEIKNLARKAGVSPEVYAKEFIDKWDAAGSTHKKTVSMVNRLMLDKRR